MTPKEIALALNALTPETLGKLDHASLYAAREYVPRDQQNRISPYEHRAFAREATAENPWMGLPIAAGTLVYQPYKVITGKSRSGASLDQVGQGLLGVGEGLWEAFQNQVQSISDRIASKGRDSSATALTAALRSYQPDSSKASTPRQ